MLARGEADAMFTIASDPGAHFPISCVKQIAKIPSVCIDPHLTPTSGVSKLHVPVAFVGVEVGGNAYRMDNVPIDMRKVVDPPAGMLTDEEFLTKVRDRVKQLKGLA
jgi:formylmethanofuran dehydrogenase subunit B